LSEGHAMPDHIHLCLSIPPKFSVSKTVGFITAAMRVVDDFGYYCLPKLVECTSPKRVSAGVFAKTML